MSFANPGAWGWAALALVVIVVYLAQLGRQPQPVATFALWQRALARRPAWFVLRHWLSLTGQLVILLLLVAALAQPFWTAAFAARRNVVVVLDVSASMATPDSRFEKMQAAAKRLAEDLNRGEQMAVVTAGSVVRIACRWTEDRQALRDTLDALQPTDGASRIAEGVEVARALLAARSNPHLVVLTDACFPEAEALAKAEGVHVYRLGQPADNVGITRLGARPHPTDPANCEVFVEATNFGAAPATRTLEFGRAGTQPESAKLDLSAGASTPKFFRVQADRDGIVSVRLKERDPLTCDDTADLWISRRQRPTVVMVPPGAAALETAFQANPRIIFKAPSAASPDERTADREGEARESKVREGEAPAEPRTANGSAGATPSPSAKAAAPQVVTVLYRDIPAQLPAGPVLAIEPQGACELWTVEGLLREAPCAVQAARLDSPLLAGVDFGSSVVEQAVRLKFTSSAETLVTAASGDALYTACQRPQGRVLVLHVNLDKSDLSRRTDFERLLDNAIQWLCHSDVPEPAPNTTEDVVALPAADAPRHLIAPGEHQLPLAAQQTFAVLDRVGVWKVADPSAENAATNSGGPALVLPSNLTNSRESDLRPAAGIASAEADGSLAFVPSGAVPDQPLWMLLVSVAIGMLVVEWCLFHRRVVV